MNILRVDFYELYQRHLCRHGQLGINLWHLAAVIGIYFSICSLAAVLIRTLFPNLSVAFQGSILAGLFVPWLAVMIVNLPAPLMFVTFLSAILLITAAVLTPWIPFWLHLIMIPAWHRVQLISHRHYTLHRDMSQFDEKYRKGATLFVLLAVYELPILLQYLIFGYHDWHR